MTDLGIENNEAANTRFFDHGEDRAAGVERAGRELLFLCHRMPYPPDKGEKIRAFHILTHLARSHAVHLGCLVDDPADLSHLDRLRDICASVGCFSVRPLVQRCRALVGIRPGRPLTIDLFYSRGLAHWVTKTLARQAIDRIFIFSSAMVEYVIDDASRTRILDMVDIDSEKWRAYARHHHWPMATVYRREARTLCALERRAAADFDATLFVSEAEASRFATLAPESRHRIGWIDNGVDLETFSPHLQFDRPFGGRTLNIVFTGTMNYWPNVDAVTWFASSVLPALQQRYPGIQFHVVGAQPGKRVLRLGRELGVIVTGRVPDVRPYLAHADIAVAPLRLARGTQNKVLEAMAMGRPVVASREAFEGLHAVPGRDLLVSDDTDQMTRQIMAILDGRHPGLGTSARLAVERNYRWAHTLRLLNDLFPTNG